MRCIVINLNERIIYFSKLFDYHKPQQQKKSESYLPYVRSVYTKRILICIRLHFKVIKITNV